MNMIKIKSMKPRKMKLPKQSLEFWRMALTLQTCSPISSTCQAVCWIRWPYPTWESYARVSCLKPHTNSKTIATQQNDERSVHWRAYQAYPKWRSVDINWPLVWFYQWEELMQLNLVLKHLIHQTQSIYNIITDLLLFFNSLNYEKCRVIIGIALLQVLSITFICWLMLT